MSAANNRSIKELPAGGRPVGGKAPELTKVLEDAYAACYAEDVK